MRTFFFIFVFASLLSLPQVTNAQSCSRATELVQKYEQGILELLHSKGDTNVYSKVINCQYRYAEKVWVIEHYISFYGVLSGTKYEAIGILTVGKNSANWDFVKGNEALYDWLLLVGAVYLLDEASKK
ncbi:hypothetical protein [Winogradskyella tangerina]|uniref:hypothetical protein n=1 Tax=Winogradskyella tangerina TaxID=2023240 RepID=UPI000DBE30D6|nr:hypothetical protein [Winogradskyella tangerina]